MFVNNLSSITSNILSQCTVCTGRSSYTLLVGYGKCVYPLFSWEIVGLLQMRDIKAAYNVVYQLSSEYNREVTCIVFKLIHGSEVDLDIQTNVGHSTSQKDDLSPPTVLPFKRLCFNTAVLLMLSNIKQFSLHLTRGEQRR